jgi:hypothetical protein
MVQVLFFWHILSVIGMLIIPIMVATRGRALYDWFVQLLSASMASYLIEMHYPSWEEPHWHTGNAWAMLAWATCILGLVIAIRKPRKRSAPVT